jgi:hypothetical protein
MQYSNSSNLGGRGVQGGRQGYPALNTPLQAREAGVLVRKLSQLTRSAKLSRLTPGILSCSVESAVS